MQLAAISISCFGQHCFGQHCYGMLRIFLKMLLHTTLSDLSAQCTHCPSDVAPIFLPRDQARLNSLPVVPKSDKDGSMTSKD